MRPTKRRVRRGERARGEEESDYARSPPCGSRGSQLTTVVAVTDGNPNSYIVPRDGPIDRAERSRRATPENPAYASLLLRLTTAAPHATVEPRCCARPGGRCATAHATYFSRREAALQAIYWGKAGVNGAELRESLAARRLNASIGSRSRLSPPPALYHSARLPLPAKRGLTPVKFRRAQSPMMMVRREKLLASCLSRSGGYASL